MCYEDRCQSQSCSWNLDNDNIFTCFQIEDAAADFYRLLHQLLSCTVNRCPVTRELQGGSDISGPLSKLHRHNKKSYFLLIISHKTFSALLRSGNINKQTHSGKYKSTGSYESCHCLQAPRRAYCERDYEHEDIQRGTIQDVIKGSQANLLLLENLLIPN